MSTSTSTPRGRLPILGLLLAALALVAPARAGDLEVHFIPLDTHGEAILVRSPAGRAALIDGGLPQAGPQVVAYLRSVGVTALDVVIATHDDPDHVGGLPHVLEAFPVAAFHEGPVRAAGIRRWLRAPLEQALAQRGVPREEVAAGARIVLDDEVTLEALGPSRPWFTRAGRDRPNDDSLVLRLEHRAMRLLLTGDATRATEARLLEQGADLRCDVLKVGHHGLDTSSSSAFLAATGARHAVVCCAPGTGPSPAVLERLEAQGIAWHRTDLNGAVVLRSSGGALTLRDTRGEPGLAGRGPFPGAGVMLRRYARVPRYAPPAADYAGALGSRIFHRASCPVRRLIPSWEVLTFGSREQARAGGRAPCPLCQPGRG